MPSASVMAQNIQLFGPREGFSPINGSSLDVDLCCKFLNKGYKEPHDMQKNMMPVRDGGADKKKKKNNNNNFLVTVCQLDMI